MMVPRATLITAIAAFVLVGSSGAAHRTPESRVLWQGPVLAGDAAVWGEGSGGKGSLHLWTQRRGARVVYTSDSLALGRPLAASRTLLAFERTYPNCPPRPNLVCPEATDALVGPLTGPYRTLVRPRTCFLPTVGNTLALDGGVATYLEVDCAEDRLRVLARDVARHGGPVVLHEAAVSSGCCRDLAIAGRRDAWGNGRDIIVYDRLARRTSYSTRIGPEGIDVDLGFDLQRDGKLAVSYRLVEFARAGPATIAWRSLSSTRLHLLNLRARDTRLVIAGSRIAFERYVTGKSGALVVADLAGRARTIARFAPPRRLRDFDFDGRRVTWASDRVTRTRTDCPPPGQGRPCVQRESGMTTIWLQAFPTGKPRVLARLPFVDTIARP